MVCSAAVTAQFIAGKATRDALYLAHLDVTTLPAAVLATSAVSILFVMASSMALRRITPAVFVPAAFVATAALLLLEWGLTFGAPRLAAVIVYLQVSGLGPMLGSGFWLIATERFDPRSARRHFAQIAGAGTLGGLGGGLLAERLASGFEVAAMLPILAGLNLVAAWLIRRLAVGGAPGVAGPRPGPPVQPVDITPELASVAPRSGLRVLAEAPYLRNLAALVLLGAAGAALIDYLFKAQAEGTFGSGEALLRFFAIYYAVTSLVAFAVQSTASRSLLERLGLAVGVAAPSAAVLAGSAGALLVPGLASATALRGSESILRSSMFRSSYEVFYTPITPRERRAAKSLIDIGFDRVGDAVGAGLILLVLAAAPAVAMPVLLTLAAGCAAAALMVAARLNRGYIETLERSLLNRALEIDLSDVHDMTTRTVMLRALPKPREKEAAPAPERPDRARSDPDADRGAQVLGKLDVEMLQVLALRSRDSDRVLRVLRTDEPLPRGLVAYVVPLLAWDLVANEAAQALRRVAEDCVGELIDALTNPNQDFAVRRRLARVFSVCVSQRAADGLLLGLDDQRFEVRYQCARSMAAITEKNPRIRVDRDRVYGVIQRETAVGKPIWESHRLLNQLDDRDEHGADEFVRDRANRSLSHVFTLLSLVLPPEPLRVAFRGLHTHDPGLRGTALEYLEGVLPPSIRAGLWPFLEDTRPISSRQVRPRDEILADLLKSHESIVLNLKRLQDTDTPSLKPWQMT
jgi:hypothetical protein